MNNRGDFRVAATRSGGLSDRRDAGPTRALRCASRLHGVLAVYLLFFHGLAQRDLWSSHEARAGMDAQTILDEGDWGVPHLYDGRPELQKPPLYYWIVASLARLRGGTVDAWDVRLPSAVAALLCVLALMAGLGRGRGRPLAGLLAAVVLATAVHFTWLARIGRIDVPLTLSVTLAVGSLVLARGCQRFKRLWLLLLAYGAMAAGVLLKGPIGVVLPAVVMLAHLTIECGFPTPRRLPDWFRALSELGVWWGVPLVGVLSLPWFFWANLHTNGEFFRVFLWHHNFERGLGGSTLRSNPWWFYGPQFVVDFLPWSPLLPLVGWWAVRRGIWRIDADARFGLVWFVSVTLVLSCSRFKRADYLLPAYPGAAVFLACVGGSWLRQLHSRKRHLAVGVFVALAVAMPLMWLVRVERQLPAKEPYRDYRSFADRVRRLAPRPAEILFFRTEAHALAFHVGRPLAVVVEWRELQNRILQPGIHYIVTPPGSVEEWPLYLFGVRLERVVSNIDLAGGSHERPLVLLRATSPMKIGEGSYTP